MPNPLRIAIDGRPALWPRTGLGTIAHNVLKCIRHAAPDAQIVAYFDSDPGERFRDYGAIEKVFGGSHEELVWSNTWLPRRLAQDDIDVYVTFLDKEVPLMRTHARIACMVRDLIPLRFPESVFRNPAHRIYYESVIRAAVHRADLILTNSQFSKREIVALLEVEEAKIRVIPLGVEPPPVISPEQHGHTLARLGVARPFVLSLGSTEPRKNVRRVLEAMNLLAPVHPQLRLAVAGSPWRGVQFDESLLSDRVTVLGQVSEADLSVLMSQAEMLVFPSLHEGFGFPLIDAMAHGTPVVTSDLSAIPEVAGDAALYADPENPGDIAAQMHALLSDHRLRLQLHRAGLARAASFRWSSTCSALAQACNDLADTSSQRWEAMAS